MNLTTIRDNLKNTIAGKEKFVERSQQNLDAYSGSNIGAEMALEATIQYVQINIDELKRILEDVEKCIQADVDRSWRDNPDRMGGQFTDNEINGNEWR